jgi:thiol:disulfide interchange protein
MDFTPLVVTGVFLLETPLSHNAFSGLFYGVLIAMACLHIAPFRMHKMSGLWVPIVTAYVLVLTIAHSLILWAD